VTAKTVAAIGIFAALAYAGSMVLMVIPNATLSILVVFFAGYCIGRFAGLLAGMISSALISLFNPFGMVALPLLGAQMAGYGLIGFTGGIVRTYLEPRSSISYYILLGTLGAAMALMYQIPVSIVDAWLFGPFQERLIMSASFALITVVSNLLFFMIFFPILAKLQKVVIFQISR